MKRALISLSLAIGLLLVLQIAPVRMLSAGADARSLTASREEQYLGGSRDAVSRTVRSTLAIRSDGSMVELFDYLAPNGQRAAQRRIMDVTARKRYIVDGLTDSLVIYPLSAASAEHHRVRQLPTCVAGAAAEKGEMLGYTVVKGERRVQDAGASLRFEEWFAPDLNCLLMSRSVWIDNSEGGPRLVKNERITSVTIGDPDASLFDVPTGLAVRSPSEMMSEFSRRYGRPVNPETVDLLNGIHRSSSEQPDAR